jgi:hypothetical protein
MVPDAGHLMVLRRVKNSNNKGLPFTGQPFIIFSGLEFQFFLLKNNLENQKFVNLLYPLRLFVIIKAEKGVLRPLAASLSHIFGKNRKTKIRRKT